MCFIFDIRQNSQCLELEELFEEHGIVCEPKQFKITRIYRWATSRPSQCEIELFRMTTQLEIKYRLPQHLSYPYVDLTRGYPEILDWLCWDEAYLEDPNPEDERAGFSQILDQFLNVRYPAPNGIERHVGVELEAIEPDNIMSFIRSNMSLTELEGVFWAWIQIPGKKPPPGPQGDKPEEWDPRESNAVRVLYAAPTRDRILHIFLRCTQSERRIFVRAIEMVAYLRRLTPAEEGMYGLPQACGGAEEACASRKEGGQAPGQSPSIHPLLGQEEPISPEGTVRRLEPAEGMGMGRSNDAAEPGHSGDGAFAALVAKWFPRYDFDQSGYIELEGEEFPQLTLALLSKLDATMPCVQYHGYDSCPCGPHPDPLFDRSSIPTAAERLALLVASPFRL